MKSILSLMDAIGAPLLLCDRSGRLVVASKSTQTYLNDHVPGAPDPNIFRDLLRIDAAVILGQLEDCEAEANLTFECPHGTVHAHVYALPDTQWLLVRLNPELSSTLGS